MAAFDIFEFFLSERQNRGMLFECPSSRQETAMAERSRKSRSTAGLCATQRGADELRRRFANSSPMNEGNFPVRKASRTRKTRKDFRYGRASFASLVARRPAPARKWRRNGLKRLNPRPRMVWSRKPLSHNIWYTGARLTVRSGEIVSDPRLWPGGHSSRIRSAGRPMENFPRNRGKSRGSVGDVSRVSLVICARLGVSSQPGTTRARLDRARNGVGSWREV